MDVKEFEAIKKTVCARLQQLNPKLTYHNLAHTWDVLKQSERIAIDEGVSGREIWLLKIAALYHDSGFLKTYRNHEEMSCSIFLEDAIHFQFSEEEKKRIQQIIMATKIPQQPHNLLEQIICDADLDYLGRDDFFAIGNELRKEFLAFGVVKSDEEWEQLQLNFLKAHKYHTQSSKVQREPHKQEHLLQLY
jgi:uncharacterized protein